MICCRADGQTDLGVGAEGRGMATEGREELENTHEVGRRSLYWAGRVLADLCRESSQITFLIQI